MTDAVPVSGPPTAADLERTALYDYDDPAVAAFTRETVAGAADEAAAASRLFAAVRERIRYDPYGLQLDHGAYAASAVLATGANWCVPKAVLLAASARAAGIPARVGFADVRNHLSSGRLTEQMGTDLFVFHGYTVLHVGGAWRKASPAFNAALCARFGTPALEFDGRSDALMHAFDGAGRRHMEYVTDRGTWTGVPFAEMFAAFREHYDLTRMVGGDGAADPVFDAAG